MTDRTVTVRLEADISDFVTDIGVKAVAAVNKLDRAASRVDGSLKKTATAGGGIGDGVKAGAATAAAELGKLAVTADKTMTTAGEKVRRTAKTQYAKAGEEAAEAFTKSSKKGSEKAGEESGKALRTGFKKWLAGGGNGLFEDLGKSGGSVFGSGFLGALKTPILGPAIVAILTAAFITAMPAVGAVAGAALVTGIGAGLAGLGILFAAQSDAVAQKWTNTLGQLGSDMRLLSAPFEGTLINIADIFQRTVDKFNPALSKAFADTAGPVEGFVARFAGGLEQLIPAIDPIVRAFSAVLDSLGRADIVDELTKSLIDLANSVEQNPEALADFARGVSEILGTSLQLIRVLNDLNASFTTLTGGTSLVDAVMEGLEASLAPVITLFAGLGKAVDIANVAVGRTGKDVADAGLSMSQAANQTVLLAQGLDKTGAAAQHGAAPMRTLEERMAAAAKKAADAKQAFEDYIDTLFRLQNLSLGLSGAQLNYQSALDAATASIKENGRTLNINTEAGRANKGALNDIARSANAQTEAMIRSGKSQVTVATTAERARGNFVRLAMQMGATRPVAQAMAASLIAIPNVTRTARLEANKKDLEAKLASAKKQLADPNLSATKRAKLQAEIKNLQAGIATAKAALATVPSSKTVTINVNTYARRIESTTVGGIPAGIKAPQANGGYYPHGIPSYADGKLPKQATIAPGKGAGLVQWAEKETGGEAFIPLAPSKRDRSTAILGQVASEFGLGLVKSFADGGFTLPGGRLVDIAFLLRQMGVAFSPTAGVSYTSSLSAKHRATRAVVPARDAALAADRAEQSAKAQVAAIQRAITLQQRAITAARAGKPTSKAGQIAEDKRVAAEQKKLIALQDQLYGAKKRVTAATVASNKADALYKVRVDAAKKATEAHAAAVEKLIEQQKAAVEFAEQIASGLTSGANIGDLFQQSLTGKGLLADLQGKGADLKKFGALINQLRARKLDEDLIQQIIGKGADQGGELAQAILDGGLGLVGSLNKAQKALEDQANLIGAGSAAVKYGTQVAGRRGGGGPVAAGKTYRVNEYGEEYFVAPVNGHISPAGMDPNRYIGSAGGNGYTTTRVVREVHNHQHNTFYGMSPDESDRIAQQANAKLELMNRGY